ncbi:primosomal protein N' [Enterococcus alcedinis]|uniref:Replication restart protein PriA n=1 Tax=Enterococcus alcedinis TaxID=1274384 RepID=A0A917N724_9ENTE|nr:primosomal protein N' [Enterococcus alcedinis]MBP2102851.1 primosomal protein N' (replication factor Y) [Enterococcus alcedinis]GGI66487.1 primosomal protein N' [Enterococcus alcedinis]
MSYYAAVIVDVPTMQTDQPYTYRVPKQWQEIIAPGMRVEVPFGEGNRHIQGFVMALSEEEPSNPEIVLKDLIRVIDLAPVVNPELLQLADYMKDVTFSFKITCLQTMLPAAMKAAYEKKFVLIDETHEIKAQYFKQQTEVDWQVIEDAGELPRFQRLRTAGVVDIRYVVKEKTKKKMVRYVNSQITEANFAEIKASLRANALRQHQLIETLKVTPRETTAFYTKQGLSAANLNQGEEQGWLTIEEVETYRDPFKDHDFPMTQPFALNDEQAHAVERIVAAETNRDATTFLLEGITGSGKTEVYLQSIAQILAKGKTAMMLVPEIALTPQMVQRFKSRFGKAVAVLHSGLSQGEKYDEWRKIERGESQVVVGARSAVFAPLENIGLIIIDEEHEATYKQDEAPRYHARDLAIWRSQYHHCPVVLGSATPSLESRARGQKNRYELLFLTKRAHEAAKLPDVTIVDLKDEYTQKNTGTFSRLLQEKIADRLVKKEQIVLLLNRRGYSSFMMCRDCGYVQECPNCDISLTLHMDVRKMACHYCGHQEAIPNKCPDCQSPKIRYYGTGTQKVEEELQTLYPSARILRMDVDTTRKKGAHERILKTFEDQKADILLGTQMIAKGLDFPNITLVGVLNADTALNLPDFRSSERTFQLLTQVSGRAGRGEKSGEVIVQTFNPDHHSIVLAQAQDYETFYRHEMRLRHQSGYPPYYFTVKISASHPSEEVAAKKMYQIAEKLKNGLSPNSQILGPIPSGVARIKNRYHYQLILKYKQEPQLHQMLREILETSQVDQRQNLFVAIDYEPLNFI